MGGILRSISTDARAYLEQENVKTELKGLMPEEAKEAIGHGGPSETLKISLKAENNLTDKSVERFLTFSCESSRCA